ncbi:MAG: AbrB/MazE/SpoVT family DNA-binding domain-containing protein [Candidatus Woesearchaeota archaeon]
MRLLSQKSREYKDKAYHKYWVVIPNKLIEKLGWKQGDELEAEIKGNKLSIERD